MQNFFLLAKGQLSSIPKKVRPAPMSCLVLNGIITKPPALIQIPYQYSAEKIEEARKKVLMTLGYSASQ